MASGKVHDAFNLFWALVLTIVLFFLQFQFELILVFNLGFLISTFIFSPDSDLMPKRRAGPLRVFLYPYSLLFKHRGLSHSLLFGTLTRIFYLVLCLGLMIWVLERMRYLDFEVRSYFSLVKHFVLQFDPHKPAYKIVIWFMSGLFIGDVLHILLDRFSSFVKRLFRF